MTEPASTATKRRSHPPLWLVEGLDVVEQRRPVFIAVTIGVIALGGILAVLAPGLVPPVPLVGAAVGVAALLLGLAVAVALDAADLRLRGPRHVGAAGGELVAVLPTTPERAGAEILADAVLEARAPGFPLLLGLAASGRDIRATVAWTDALATALEAEGVSVLRIDLASGHTGSPGLLEVVRDGVKLASAVTFGPEPRLARLGAGDDLNAALGTLAALPGRLPRDLDVLLVALPMAASKPVVTAVRSLDHVLIVAQRDRTSRVELIAGLDALEAAGTRAQVALLDDRTAARLAPRRTTAMADPEPADGPEDAASLDDDAPPATSASDGPDPAPAVADDAPPAADAAPSPDRGPTPVIESSRAEELEQEPAERRETDGPEASSEPGLESEPEVATDPEPAPGPRSGGAFGVGGAALTAAGIASAFNRPQAEPAERSDAPEASNEPADLTIEQPQTPPRRADAPQHETSVLGLEDDDGAGPEGDDDDPGDGWLSWDDTPRDAEDGDLTPELADSDGSDRSPTSAAAHPDAERAGSSAVHERSASERSERRDVEVVHGAAEAAAIALVQLPAELPFDPGEPAVEEGGALPVGAEARPPAQVAPDLPPAPVALHTETGADTDPAPSRPGDTPAGPDAAATGQQGEPSRGDAPEPSDPGSPVASAPIDAAPGTAPEAADPDRTDEIPAVRAQREAGDAHAEHDEMMRTTAQLSVLLDDQDLGGDERPLDTP